MKTIVPVALLAAGLMFGQAQVPREKTDTATVKTDKGTAHVKELSVVGKLKSYTEGKKLTVTSPKGKTETFSLTGKNVHVTGIENVKVGDMVKVVRKKENNQTNILVEPYNSTTAHNR